MHKNNIHKGGDMKCYVKTHTLIVNEIFSKLNVIVLLDIPISLQLLRSFFDSEEISQQSLDPEDVI